MDALGKKFREVITSVVPITVLVIAINFLALFAGRGTPLSGSQFGRFSVGSLLVILGLTVFLFGIDIGITPIGENVGLSVAKTGRGVIVALAALVLGFLICVAEPDLEILAGQIEVITENAINRWLLIIIVSLGVGGMVMIGMLRIVFDWSMRLIFAITYGIIFLLALFASPDFLAFAFDASGATTGAITVPFILALSFGVSRVKRHHGSDEEDSFGLSGFASAGAILTVLLFGVITRQGAMATTVSGISSEQGFFAPFGPAITSSLLEILLSLAPIILVLIVYQLASKKFTQAEFIKLSKGLVYIYLGLVLFMTGVKAGFMDAGTIIGRFIGQNKGLAITLGFAVGVVIVLAEPAVHVLTTQIEDITHGFVSKKLVLIMFSSGIAISVGLAMIKAVTTSVKLWHFLLPGYILALGLMFFTPKLFVGMAYDAGGVASGPMSATFVLAFSQGVAFSSYAAGTQVPLVDAFGTIALIAMMPIIMVEALGILYRIKLGKQEAIHAE